VNQFTFPEVSTYTHFPASSTGLNYI